MTLGKIDTVKGARLRGIFLSNKSCFVVYVSKKYDNKILRVNIKGEQNLKKDLEASIQYFTNVMRRIPAFDKYTTFKGDRTRTSIPFTNGVYALFFSDGDILAYSIATGYSKGKSNKRDIVKLNAKIEKTYLKNETENASVYLTAASDRFDKMYVIPTTVNGKTALEIEALIPKAEEISSKNRSSTKENSIVCYAGPALKKQINEIVKKEHTDISKFVRKALKEYIKNHYES